LIGVKNGNVHSSDEQALVDIQKGLSMICEIKEAAEKPRGAKRNHTFHKAN